MECLPGTCPATFRGARELCRGRWAPRVLRSLTHAGGQRMMSLLMSFRSIGMRISAQTRATDTASRKRHLPYDSSRVRQHQEAPEPGHRSAWRRSPREYALLIILVTFVGRVI